MNIRNIAFDFPMMRGNGPRSNQRTVVFSSPVSKAVAAISGYSAQFGGNNDHHFGRLEVRVTTEIIGETVNINTYLGMRDWSGNWDDDYGGVIDVTVFAELDEQVEQNYRTDLTITGIETTQVIQHFRNSNISDPNEGGPDNSIPLIAGKDTALRVYVDYSPGQTGALINSMSGEIVVQTSSGVSFTLIPFETITPRPDISIDRNISNHTLNFLIPDGWCQGIVDISCQVYDPKDISKKSYKFQRTLNFINVAPLSTYGVGIHYTGQGLDLPAPTMSEAINTLGFAERVYPVGEILVNGYTTIDFNKDMKADIANGCGEGFSELLSVLRDMRGDSEDLYWAVLPHGVDTGSVGGCGGGGAAAQFVGSQNALAEEFGHALGRSHAPAWTSTVPANQDENFPVYSTYPSGSIGETGYNTLNNEVYNPASTYDFMGYASPEWISTYTYLGILSRMGYEDSSAYPSISRINIHSDKHLEVKECNRKKRETLFLSLTISRERMVVRDFMFHFPAFPSLPNGIKSDFYVDFLDKDHNVLSSNQLYQSCSHCQLSCWPKKFRQPVPFPNNSRTMVIWENDKKIYEENIPEAPKIIVKSSSTKSGNNPGINLSWGLSDVDESENSTDKTEGLHYLVQWQDANGNWRGTAPRTTKKKQFIPVSALQLSPRQTNVSLRVLATSGIATSITMAAVQDIKPPSISHRINIQGESSFKKADKVQMLPFVLKAKIIDNNGLTIDGGNIRWFDENGHEIGRGRTINMRQLSIGQQVISADALGIGAGIAKTSWLVDISERGIQILKRI